MVRSLAGCLSKNSPFFRTGDPVPKSPLKTIGELYARRILAIGLALAALSSLSTRLSAQSTAVVVTAPGKITKILSEYNNNALLVHIDSNVAFMNPAACELTDYYETNPTDAGATLNHSLLITAYTSKSNVSLIIQGCSFDRRPHIISVSLPD